MAYPSAIMSDDLKSGLAWIATLVALGWYLHEVAIAAARNPAGPFPVLPALIVCTAVALAVYWRIAATRETPRLGRRREARSGS